MTTTEAEKTLELDVKSCLRDGHAIITITKIYGNVNLKHRGHEMMGGMNWVPDGNLPVGLTVDGEIINDALNKEQLVVLFQDLMGTLMPSIKVLVNAVDGKANEESDEKKEDF